MGKKRWTKEQEILSKLLREVRLEAGLTQWELADKLGHSQNYVHKFETGDKRVDLLELRDICKAVEVDPVEFLRRLEAVLEK